MGPILIFSLWRTSFSNIIHREAFFQWMCMAAFYKIRWLSVSGTVSTYSNLCHLSLGLFFSTSTTLSFITVAVPYNFKWSIVMAPALLFLPRIAFTILSLYWFKMIFRIALILWNHFLQFCVWQKECSPLILHECCWDSISTSISASVSSAV